MNNGQVVHYENVHIATRDNDVARVIMNHAGVSHAAGGKRHVYIGPAVDERTGKVRSLAHLGSDPVFGLYALPAEESAPYLSGRSLVNLETALEQSPAFSREVISFQGFILDQKVPVSNNIFDSFRSPYAQRQAEKMYQRDAA
jgi:hypothetical protein